MSEIRALTSLRGVAAIYVILYHFSNLIAPLADGEIFALAPRGWLGVDLFFALSGFIMAYTYAGDFQERGIAAYSNFLLKRVARILPLNVAVVLTLAVFYFMFGDAVQMTGRLLLCNLSLLQSFGVCWNFNPPSWSVGVEWVSYFLFPALLRITLFGRPATCIMALTTATVALTILALQGSSLTVDTVPLGPGFGIVRCVSEFTFGLGAYRLYKLQQPLFGSNMLLLVLVGLCAVIILSRRDDLFAALLFPLVITALASNRDWPARIAEWLPLHFLGVISYSLYLVHHPLIQLEIYFLHHFHPDKIPHVWSYAVIIAGTISMIVPSYFTYRAVERPGRALVRDLFASFRIPAVLDAGLPPTSPPQL
ncbi:MAG: acyltransferase [Rhodospirillaceae bacterium]|nr:MAG: acyltransferase [Rhodospirillaceae bacterium]